MVGLGFVIMVALALFFYRIADAEGRSGGAWALASVLLYVASSTLLDLAIFPLLGIQALLFGGMWMQNIRQRG